MSLFLLRAKIILLSIITLGIYSFWGRTELRRYFTRNSQLDGHALDYHGTGLELFIGGLKAVLLLVPLYLQFFLCVLMLGKEAGTVVGMVILYLALLAAVPLAIVGSWRYRLSRTSYRGLRFSFRGRYADFLPGFAGYGFLTLVTLGICYPLLLHTMRDFYARNAWYGDTRFGYYGRGSDLLGPWVISLLLASFTFGISLLWFNQRRFNYQWSHTSFGPARFSATIEPGAYLIVMITNWLLTLLTFGIGWSWAQVRTARFEAENLRLEGSVDWARIHQQFLDASSTGEGFSNLLDTTIGDVGLGL